MAPIATAELLRDPQAREGIERFAKLERRKIIVLGNEDQLEIVQEWIQQIEGATTLNSPSGVSQTWTTPQQTEIFWLNHRRDWLKHRNPNFNDIAIRKRRRARSKEARMDVGKRSQAYPKRTG